MMRFSGLKESVAIWRLSCLNVAECSNRSEEKSCRSRSLFWKAEKMKAELSRMIQDAGYANASEFYTELFMVREEKRKYDEACKKWQQKCVEVKIEAQRNGTGKEQSRLSDIGRSI